MIDYHPRIKQYTTMIRVRILERSRRWLETMFGYQVTYRDLRLPLITMNLNGSCPLTLWELEPDQPLRPMNDYGAYIVLLTDHVQPLYDWVMQQGAETGPIEQEPGLLFFRVTDPDGHVYVVVQVLPE